MDNKELKNLLENDVLSDEVKALIVEAWESKVQTVREEVSAEIRNEFATKYEKDKSEIVEAMNAMIQDVLTSNLTEVHAEKNAAVAEQVRYKKAIRENNKNFNTFCQKVLKNEVKEFRQDRKAVAESMGKINDFIVAQVSTVLEDFHNEKRKLAEAKVEFKIHAKKELSETKAKLVKEQAKLASAFVTKIVTEELTQLKDELKVAKENNLGRKIFEAYFAEFSTSYFNESKEVKKLTKTIKEKEAQVEAISKELHASKTKLTESQNVNAVTKEKLERSAIMNEILSPLGGEKRAIMKEMLDKHPTSKIRGQFEKYLPMIIEGSVRVSSRMLNEDSHITERNGNRKNIISESKEEDKKLISDFVSQFNKINVVKQ